MKRLIPFLFLLCPSISFAWTAVGSPVGTIQLRNDLQSGATLYVSSGTIEGNLYVDSLFQVGTPGISMSDADLYFDAGTVYPGLHLNIDDPTGSQLNTIYFDISNTENDYIQYALASGFNVYVASSGPTLRFSIARTNGGTISMKDDQGVEKFSVHTDSVTSFANLFADKNFISTGQITNSGEDSPFVFGHTRSNKFDLTARSTATTRTPMVTFMFDDGYLTDYTIMFSTAQAKGVPMGCAIVTDAIGTANYMTQEQILELQSAGWEIMSHTKSHVDLRTLNEDQLVEELRGSKLALESFGCVVNNFVNPFHYSGEFIRNIIKRYYRSARSNDANTYPNNQSVLYTYKLGGYLAGALSEAAMEAIVDSAETSGEWVIFYLHQTDAADATRIGNVIDYIQAKGIAIVTINEALNEWENIIDYGDQGMGTSFSLAPDGSIKANTVGAVGSVEIWNPAYPQAHNVSLTYSGSDLMLTPYGANDVKTAAGIASFRPNDRRLTELGQTSAEWATVWAKGMSSSYQDLNFQAARDIFLKTGGAVTRLEVDEGGEFKFQGNDLTGIGNLTSTGTVQVGQVYSTFTANGSATTYMKKNLYNLPYDSFEGETAYLDDTTMNVTGTIVAGASYGRRLNILDSSDIEITDAGSYTIHSDYINRAFSGTMGGEADSSVSLYGRYTGLSGNMADTNSTVNKYGHKIVVAGTGDLNIGLDVAAGEATSNIAINVLAGDVIIAADDTKLSLGAAGSVDSYLQFGGTDLEYYSSGSHVFTGTVAAEGISIDSTINHTIVDSSGDLIITNPNLNEDIFFNFNDDSTMKTIGIDSSRSRLYLPASGILEIGDAEITNGSNSYQLKTAAHWWSDGRMSIGPASPENDYSIKIVGQDTSSNTHLYYGKLDDEHTDYFLQFVDEGDTDKLLIPADGSIVSAGMVRQASTWHVYGGTQAASTTIPCATKDTWYMMTDAQGLWNGTEADGFTLAGDTMTVTNTGDYFGSLSMTFSDSTGRDFQFRVYNITTAASATLSIGATTTGATNFANVTLPLYVEATAGDELIMQVRCTSTNSADPTFKSAVFYLSYLHD
ncbi:MAG TPA: polysaccharide deacetylase family protein [Anaerolineales bacterium]|nr:polysaccharide deacetylase family protein [Anaerolineales bacterium]